MQRSLGVSVLRLVTGQVPDDQGLVTTGRQEHVGAASRRGRELAPSVFHRVHRCCHDRFERMSSYVLLHGGSQAGDPAILCAHIVSLLFI